MWSTRGATLGRMLPRTLPMRRYRVAGLEQVRAHVADMGMACCAVEFVAAVAQGLLVAEPGGSGATQGAHGDADDDSDDVVNVLIVSGTVTHALTPSVVAAWEAVAQPRAVIAFGACTISGGPYWDSYAVAPGIDAVVPVTRYVPGCPPRPEALIEAIEAAARDATSHRSEVG